MPEQALGWEVGGVSRKRTLPVLNLVQKLGFTVPSIPLLQLYQNLASTSGMIAN